MDYLNNAFQIFCSINFELLNLVFYTIECIAAQWNSGPKSSEVCRDPLHTPFCIVVFFDIFYKYHTSHGGVRVL